MNLESSKITIEKSAEELFTTLSDVTNFEKLMPDNVAKFEVLDADSFIFALKGMPEIKLRKKETTPHSTIILGSANDKMPFSLTQRITSTASNTSEIQIQFEGKFNPMMTMMIKGPISKFIETLVQNVNKL